MSKNKNHNNSVDHLSAAHAEEYKLIRQDLLRVVVLNAIYLAGLLALYYANNQSRFLEKWFEQIF